VLNSNNFVPPKLPARANAANPPPPLATVCSGLESTDWVGVSFDDTDDETAANSLCVPNAGVVGATTIFPVLAAFDLLPGNGSTNSGRFGVFLLAVEDLDEEEDEDDGTFPVCRGGDGGAGVMACGKVHAGQW